MTAEPTAMGTCPRRTVHFIVIGENEEMGIFHPSFWGELDSAEKVGALKETHIHTHARSLCTELASLLPCPVVPDTLDQGLATLPHACISSSKLMWP